MTKRKRGRGMKAWAVKEKRMFYCGVVFAETAGQARAIARYTDACEDVDFIDIEVRREPNLDKYYTVGKLKMNWDNPEDRLALVKECNFQCVYIEPDECANCSAKEHCGLYEEETESEEDG